MSAIDPTNENLTLSEVAADLRCSKSHVCNLISGKVAGAPRLPVIVMGRRKLVRRSSLEEWLRAVEEGRDKLASPETVAGRMAEGVYHA